MDVISYKLPVFEGPLDLLLFLVQKNKLNIYDIPIAEVLEQYMDAIRRMQEVDLDVATEFLDMAARLVQIKSSMLLPRHEEAEALKRELTGELIEYKLCQEAARRLAARNVGGDIFTREPEEFEPDMTYRRTHAPSELLDAYLAGFRRRPRLSAASWPAGLCRCPPRSFSCSAASTAGHACPTIRCLTPRPTSRSWWPPSWPCWSW